jgi:opine dehydrogenase
MNILIVGFGNVGCGIAADLSIKGHNITALKTSDAVHEDNYKCVFTNKKITMVEKGISLVAQLDCLTKDVHEAFKTYPDVIIVTTQSLQHDRIAKIIVPFLHAETIVLLEPGNAGSLLMSRFQLPKGVTITEATSSPIDVRIKAPGVVNVLFRNVRNPLGFSPMSGSVQALLKLQALYPNFYCLGHTLAAALHNPNLIVHTVGSLLSIPRIEYSKGEFWMYKEGLTKSVWNVIEALDAEKMEVLKRLDADPMPYLEIAKIRNAENLSIDAREMFDIYCQTGSPKGPSSINTRYIYEDVPKGLVLLESLGKLTKCKTRTASMLIDLAQAYTKEDFRKTGSSLQRLGIAEHTVASLLAWLKYGRPAH